RLAGRRVVGVSGHVAGNRLDVIADLLLQEPELVGGLVEGDDARSLGDETAYQRRAEPGPGARHDDRGTLKPAHGLSLPDTVAVWQGHEQVAADLRQRVHAQ